METLQHVSTGVILLVKEITKTGIIHAKIVAHTFSDKYDSATINRRYPLGQKTKLTKQAVEAGLYTVLK